MFEFLKPSAGKMQIKVAGLKAELECITNLMNRLETFPVTYVDRRLELVRKIAELETRIDLIVLNMWGY